MLRFVVACLASAATTVGAIVVYQWWEAKSLVKHNKTTSNLQLYMPPPLYTSFQDTSGTYWNVYLGYGVANTNGVTPQPLSSLPSWVFSSGTDNTTYWANIASCFDKSTVEAIQLDAFNATPVSCGAGPLTNMSNFGNPPVTLVKTTNNSSCLLDPWTNLLYATPLNSQNLYQTCFNGGSGSMCSYLFNENSGLESIDGTCMATFTTALSQLPSNISVPYQNRLNQFTAGTQAPPIFASACGQNPNNPPTLAHSLDQNTLNTYSYTNGYPQTAQANGTNIAGIVAHVIASIGEAFLEML